MPRSFRSKITLCNVHHAALAFFNPFNIFCICVGQYCIVALVNIVMLFSLSAVEEKSSRTWKRKTWFCNACILPVRKRLPEGLFSSSLNGRYKRRDEERGLFFHTKQRAKIVNEDGGTASNSSCRKHFLSHSEELTRIGHPTIWKSGDWEGGQPHHFHNKNNVRVWKKLIFFFKVNFVRHELQ